MKTAAKHFTMLAVVSLAAWSCGEKTESGGRAGPGGEGNSEKVPAASVDPTSGTTTDQPAGTADGASGQSGEKKEEDKKTDGKTEIPAGKPEIDVPRTLRTKTEYKGALAKTFGIKQSDLDATYNLIVDNLPGEPVVSEKTIHVGYLTGITQMASTACNHFLLRNLSVAGIPQGYDSGDLVFKANIYNNAANAGEFTVSGTSFKVGEATFNIGNIRQGVAAQDDATGYGYLMYRENIRASGMTPEANNSDNLIAVRYFQNKWQYDTNTAWKDFTPKAGDRLLALVNFTTDEIIPLQGNVQDNAALPATVEAKLNIVYDRIFLRISDRNAAVAKIADLITGIEDQALAFTLACSAAASTLAFF